MKMPDSWWAKKLGTTPAPRREPMYQQPAPVVRAPQYQQQQPQQQQQIQVTGENLFEAAKMWQGGEATRTETQPCPQCGSPHFFSRSQGIHRGPPPAPMCDSCGFNGLFTQGDPSSWNSA